MKLIFIVLLILLVVCAKCGGWKLRGGDILSEDDNKLQPRLKLTVSKVLEAASLKSSTRDLPFRKIERVEHIDDDETDDEEDDKSNLNEANDDMGNQDEYKEPKFVFEKVNKANIEKNANTKHEKLLRKFVTEENEAGNQKIKENQTESVGGFFSWFRTSSVNVINTVPKNIIVKSEEINAPNIEHIGYLKNVFQSVWTTINTKSNEVVSVVEDKVQVFHKLEDMEKPSPTLTSSEWMKLLYSFPSFVPEYQSLSDESCQRAGQIFLRQLKGQKLWPLKMIDSSGKISSGLFLGNANQLGHFDVCTGIRTKVKVSDEESINIKGKYCLAHIHIKAINEGLKGPVHLIHGKNLLRSNLRDPSHFFPPFTTIKWGLCIPHKCSHRDAEQSLLNSWSPYNNTGIKISINIDEDNCYIEHSTKWQSLLKNWQTFVAMLYFGLACAAAFFATINDFWITLKLDVFLAPDRKKSVTLADAQEIPKPVDTTNAESNNGFVNDLEDSENPLFDKTTFCEESDERKHDSPSLVNQFIMAFSVKDSLKKLFSINDNDIGCIHGLKALASLLLFITIKFLSVGHMPLANRTNFSELLSSPITVFIRVPFLYMDTFVFISGALAAFSIYSTMENRTSIPWKRIIIGRVIRVLPALICVLMFTAWIWPHIGKGPQWGDLVIQNSKLCKQGLWRNILNIQNLSPFETQCAPHLQDVAILVQLFAVTPILVWLLRVKPDIGFAIYGILLAFSVGVRYSSTVRDRLSYVVFYGMKLSQLYRTMNWSFGNTLHRSTTYLIGFSTGYFLKQTKGTELPKGIKWAGWISSGLMIVWCFWTPLNLSHRDYIYEPTEAAQYAAWAPIIWSLGLSWIVFACFNGFGGCLDTFLSAKLFAFFSKISYSILLVQFLVVFSFVGTSHASQNFNLSLVVDIVEVLLIISLAVLISILFDFPMAKINQIVLRRMSLENNLTNTINHAGEEIMHKESKAVDPILKNEEDVIPATTNDSSKRLSWTISEPEVEDFNSKPFVIFNEKTVVVSEDEESEEESEEESGQEEEENNSKKFEQGEEKDELDEPFSSSTGLRRWRYNNIS